MRTESTAILRPAAPDDLPRIAELHLRSRDAAFPAMPHGAHPPDDVRAYVTGWDLRKREVWVADSAGGLLGYTMIHRGWVDDLYVDPSAAGTGIGSALLELVKTLRSDGFCLWVFESNASARSFYASRGLVELERTDGSANEEQSPDIRLAWPGSDPLAFLRGLIDEVDAQLAELLARRVALTGAVQDVKHDTSRDPARERAIADAMACTAPVLGSERLARIVHTIITESLDATAVR